MRRSFFALILLLTPQLSWAFLIEDIEVRGLARISKGTVLNYLPLRVGERFDQERSSGLAMRALYETGLFEDVALFHKDGVLIVAVTERPAIGEIKLEGNRKLDTDTLMETLRQAGIAKGRVFNRSTLEEVENELRRLYFSSGNYAAKVEVEAIPLPRNRVSVDIQISEGEIARIRQINLVGNQSYPDDELLGLLDSGEYTINPFSTADEYSRIKLSGDIETLRSYYLDRGYLRFDVTSTQVSLSPDKKDIFVTINMKEGERYVVRSVRLAGEFPVPEEELKGLIEIKPADYFSRKAISATTSEISDRLGEEGYAFANVNAVPEVDEAKKEVDLTFFVDPGKRVYVRRINIFGNTETDEIVLRREIRQMEGAWLSPKDLRRSQTRLQRLSYLESVNIETIRVPGTDDQVDINIDVAEGSTGSFSIGAGVTSDGFALTLDFNQENIFGTGNRWNLSFDNTDSTNQFSSSFTDPYYTEDGISRTIKGFAREVDATEESVTSDYVMDSYGFSLDYGIPLSEYATFRLGIGWESNNVETTDGTSDEIINFIAQHDDNYHDYFFNLGHTYDTRDRTIFATQGLVNKLSAKVIVPGSDLEYFKISNQFDYYYPLTSGLVLSTSANISYGDGYQGGLGELPFYTRYFVGGVRSLRGFKSGSLGPKDSNNDATGGDFKTVGSIELVFPVPLSESSKTTRLSTFVDFGNVFADYEDFDEKAFRVSGGLSFVWLAPIGPLTFSYAVPLEKESGDRVERFQFTIGTIF